MFGDSADISQIEQLVAEAQSLSKEHHESMDDKSTIIKQRGIALGKLKQELADLRSAHEQEILEAGEEARDDLTNEQ